VGFHVLSDNAGEITQGYSVAMRCGATKADFDNTIGIHPTISEVSSDAVSLYHSIQQLGLDHSSPHIIFCAFYASADPH